MTRNQKVMVAKFATVLAVPVILWAHSTGGPDPHYTGVQGTGEQTCNATNCHVGTPLNGGGGSLKVTAADGTTYTPGKKQTITISITDSAARVYGFQATARLSSSRTTMAGTFTPGANQQVLCASVDNSDLGVNRQDPRPCPSGQPLEFIEHTRALTTSTITVDWTPPASASGDIEIWVSTNAANGDGTERGDHIYNTSLKLSAASGGGPKPAISAGGIINAGQFGAKPGVAPGTWIEIYGANFSSTTREWGGSDFKGSTAPNTLDGVGVTVAGKPAFIRFISPGQVNVQVPDGIGTGPVPVVVSFNGQSSDPITVTASSTLPGLLAPFNSGGKNYVAAFQGATIVGSPGFAAVKPGDTVTLYGVGWGAVSPSVPAGNINTSLTKLTGKLVLRLSQIDVSNISYQGLGPNFVGLYQINLAVPANAPDGDLALDASIDGVSTGQTLFLTVKK